MQQTEAKVYFILIVCINLFILAVIITGIIIGVHGYISDAKLTYASVTCCGSICSRCFFTLSTIFTILPCICILICSIGIIAAVYKTLRILTQQHKIMRDFKTRFIMVFPELKNTAELLHSYNHLLLFNDKLHCAFTMGLWNPKIYFSSGICSYLTMDELTAVLLHEIHHKKSNDPLKLFIIQILCAVNFFIPINRHLSNLFLSATEKAADDNAVRYTGDPLTLASALAKIAKSNHDATRFYTSSSVQIINMAEDRLARLLKIETSPPYSLRTSSFFPCILSFFIAAIVCMPLFFKQLLSVYTIDCNIKICHVAGCG